MTRSSVATLPVLRNPSKAAPAVAGRINCTVRNSQGVDSETVAEPVTLLFGMITIWYVPVVASVLPAKVAVPFENVDASTLPLGLSKYTQKKPELKLGVTCTEAVCPAVPLKLNPTSELAPGDFVACVPKAIVSFVVWLMSETLMDPLTVLFGMITI